MAIVGWNERQGFQRFFLFFYRLWRCAAGVRTFLSALKRGMFHLSKPTLPGAAWDIDLYTHGGGSDVIMWTKILTATANVFLEQHCYHLAYYPLQHWH